MTTESRNLAAIMFTDIVGYSSKTQKNETLALELLELHRVMVREILERHNGVEVKTIGDAFLLEFKSAIDAVLCAIAIQKALADYNKTSTEDRKIYLRIGIHIGDVVHREGDIYGDGVNISSRLEPLAQPGGICFSEDVARLIHGKIDLKIHKMGKQDLKNIELPIEVFQINRYVNDEVVKATKDNNKLAVLPFQNISPDPDSDYFSDGLTEEITMHLSRIKELQVVSRTTCMQFKNAQMDIVSLGKELKARYILEGSVRKHEDKLRITAQLIDVNTDSHLWAETYNGNMADIFDIQESVSKKIVESLRLTLSPADKVALVKKTTTNSEAFDIVLRGRDFLYRRTKSHLLTAIDLFENAIELDPRYASAYAGMSLAYTVLHETHDGKSDYLEKATESALKALTYDSTSSDANSALGYVHYCRDAKTEALASLRKAVELDRDNFFAYWVRGRLYRMMNNDRDAIFDFKKVLELNPEFHSAYSDLQMSYQKLGDDLGLEEVQNDALKFYPSYLLRYPDDPRAHMFYAFFLQSSGQLEKARSRMQRAIEISPNDVNMTYNAACFFAEIGDVKESIETLKKAIDNGFGNYEYIKHDPDLNSIRNEPEYAKLMKGLENRLSQ